MLFYLDIEICEMDLCIWLWKVNWTMIMDTMKQMIGSIIMFNQFCLARALNLKQMDSKHSATWFLDFSFIVALCIREELILEIFFV